MHILHEKTTADIVSSLLAEVAKSQNEIRCARADLEKASSRLQFCIAAINELINRQQEIQR